MWFDLDTIPRVKLIQRMNQLVTAVDTHAEGITFIRVIMARFGPPWDIDLLTDVHRSYDGFRIEIIRSGEPHATMRRTAEEAYAVLLELQRLLKSWMSQAQRSKDDLTSKAMDELVPSIATQN